MCGAKSASVRTPTPCQYGHADGLARAKGHFHDVFVRLGKRVQVLNGGAKSSVEEPVALASREGAGYGRIEATAFFDLRPLVTYGGKKRGKSGLAFAHRHSIDLRMLLEDVIGMEGGMLAAPYTVDVGKRGPDPSRDFDAVSVVGKGME